MTGTYPDINAAGGAPPASRLLNALLLGTAVLIAVAMPTIYFGLSYSALGAALQIKADVKAEVINQHITRSPQMWRFEETRLRDLLMRVPAETLHESGLVLDMQSNPLAGSTNLIEGPTMTRSSALYDSGTQVGSVQISMSLNELMLETSIAGLMGLIVAGIMFLALREVQRAEQDVADAQFDAQERARVTLNAIGDAVVTVDNLGFIDYLNPVAERLTQWTLAEARGTPIHDVVRTIDERTAAPVPSKLDHAMRENTPYDFNGLELALVARDGTTIAIEDSAAPLRDQHGNVIGGALVFHDVTTTRSMAQRISWAATHDALTGLINRREFEQRVDQALGFSRNSERSDVVCYLDLDQFKIVNDTCGHVAGDALLKQLSAQLQLRVRQSDTLARLGGDEFGVLLEGCTLERAQIIAADLLSAVRNHRFQWQDKVFNIGVSIGMLAISPDFGSREDIFIAVDTACYNAKEQGRNRICVFQSSDSDLAKRRTEMGWAARLTTALEEERLTLYFQPYRALSEGSSNSLHIEILLRLNDDNGELIAPGSFLPAAERYNMMPAIDRWVIKTVFSQYASLVAQAGEHLTCAINLSATTLNTEGILDFIRDAAREHQLPHGSICFEVTESAAINNMRQATAFMRDVKALGISFALDDFGVGTSSLAYLKSLPVDYLKIDGSFIRNIVADPVDYAMADTINRVGHIMGLKTVGEYAENEEVIAKLREIGVDFAQGYAVQKPRPLSTLGHLACDAQC